MQLLSPKDPDDGGLNVQVASNGRNAGVPAQPDLTFHRIINIGKTIRIIYSNHLSPKLVIAAP